MITTEQIAELRRLCEAATPGPWVRSKYGFNILTHDSELSTCTQRYTGDKKPTEEEMAVMVANAAFIAAARTALPALLDEVERMQRERREDIALMEETLQAEKIGIARIEKAEAEAGAMREALAELTEAVRRGPIKERFISLSDWIGLYKKGKQALSISSGTALLLALVVALTIGYGSMRREMGRQIAEMQAAVERQAEMVSLLAEGQQGMREYSDILLSRVQGVECWVGIGDAAGKPVEQP